MRKGLLFLIVLGAAMMTAVSVSGQEQLKKLINAQFAISQFYVDSVNDDRLVEDAIKDAEAAAVLMMQGQVDKAMNDFNAKKQE